MLRDRATLEAMIRATEGRRVTVGVGTVSAEETWGHFDIADEVMQDDVVLAGVPILTVPSMVAGFVHGATVQIEDEALHKVRWSQRQDDGALRRVVLLEA